MVAPPPGLFPARASASGKQQQQPPQQRTLQPETQISDISRASPVLSMSCSEENVSSSSSSSLVSNPQTSPAANSVNVFPTPSNPSRTSSLGEDALSLKTATSLKSGCLGPSKAQVRKSSSQPPLPQSRSTGRRIFSSFPEDWPPPSRTPVAAMPEAGCSMPLGSLKSSSSQLSSLLAPKPICLGEGERWWQPRDKEGNFEQQLSDMEARLKAVQEQQTLWLQELVPAVRRVRSELANIGQSLGKLVQMFEAQVLTCPQEKAAGKVEGSRAAGKHLFHPAFTHHPCQEI